MPNSLSIPLVNTETISIYFLIYYNGASKIYAVLFQYLYYYKMKANRLKYFPKRI